MTVCAPAPQSRCIARCPELSFTRIAFVRVEGSGSSPLRVLGLVREGSGGFRRTSGFRRRSLSHISSDSGEWWPGLGLRFKGLGYRDYDVACRVAGLRCSGRGTEPPPLYRTPPPSTGGVRLRGGSTAGRRGGVDSGVLRLATFWLCLIASTKANFSCLFVLEVLLVMCSMASAG